MTTYKEKLQDPRWQKKRLEILKRDKFTCCLCGDKKTSLQVHHKKYSSQPWTISNADLTTLCKYCHLSIEYMKDINSVIVIERIINVKKVAFNYMYVIVKHPEKGIHIFLLNVEKDKNSKEDVQYMSVIPFESFETIYKEAKKRKKNG